LNVPNIYPNNGHVGFRGDFDDSWLRYKGDIIEYVVLLEDHFDVI